MKRILVFVCLLTLVAGINFAQKAKFDPGLKEKLKAEYKDFVYAVVMVDNMPTGTEKGEKAEDSTATAFVKADDGGPIEKKKFLGVAMDMGNTYLNKGEIVQIRDISVGKNDVTFAIRTVRQIEVTRGKGIFEKKYPEYHRTQLEMNFSIPYCTDTPESLNFIKTSVEKYFKPFKTMDEATVFVNSTNMGGSVEIKIGMTIEEVVKLLGLPKQKMESGNVIKYKYDDWKITFENGVVTEVDF